MNTVSSHHHTIILHTRIDAIHVVKQTNLYCYECCTLQSFELTRLYILMTLTLREWNDMLFKWKTFGEITFYSKVTDRNYVLWFLWKVDVWVRIVWAARTMSEPVLTIREKKKTKFWLFSFLYSTIVVIGIVEDSGICHRKKSDFSMRDAVLIRRFDYSFRRFSFGYFVVVAAVVVVVLPRLTKIWMNKLTHENRKTRFDNDSNGLWLIHFSFSLLVRRHFRFHKHTLARGWVRRWRIQTKDSDTCKHQIVAGFFVPPTNRIVRSTPNPMQMTTKGSIDI